MKKIVLLCLFVVLGSGAWSHGTVEIEMSLGAVTRREYRGFRGQINGQPSLFFLVFDDQSLRIGMVVFDWRGEVSVGFDNVSVSFSEGEDSITGSVCADDGKTVLFSGNTDPYWRTLIVYRYEFSASEKGCHFEYCYEIPYFPADKTDAAVKMTAAVTGDGAIATVGPYGNSDAVKKYMTRLLLPELSQWQEAVGNSGDSYHFEKISEIQFLYADRDLLSLQTKVYEYTGGAHGISAVSGFVFERASGKRVAGLDWLDYTDSEFVKTVRIKLISEPSALTEDSFYDYTKLGFDPECQWVLTTCGILFIWSQYQLGPYSSGIPEALFSFDEIRPYVKTKMFPGNLFR